MVTPMNCREKRSSLLRILHRSLAWEPSLPPSFLSFVGNYTLDLSSHTACLDSPLAVAKKTSPLKLLRQLKALGAATQHPPGGVPQLLPFLGREKGKQRRCQQIVFNDFPFSSFPSTLTLSSVAITKSNLGHVWQRAWLLLTTGHAAHHFLLIPFPTSH